MQMERDISGQSVCHMCAQWQNAMGYNTCGALLRDGYHPMLGWVCDDRLMGVPFVILGIGGRKMAVGCKDIPSNWGVYCISLGVLEQEVTACGRDLFTLIFGDHTTSVRI